MGFGGNDIVPFDAEALKYVPHQLVVGRAIDELGVYETYREEKRPVLMGLIRAWASREELSGDLLVSLREWKEGEVTVALHLLGRYVSPELSNWCRRELTACQSAV